jgi:vitamin B12 transporter
MKIFVQPVEGSVQNPVARIASRRTAWSVFLMIGLMLFLRADFAWGEDEDRRSLELYNGGSVETVSASRSPRPASQTAENISVVTAQEIESLNAHTLADILVVIPGIQFESYQTPGSSGNFTIQGSRFDHVLVLVDNVPINNLTSNFPDIATIPAQIIERVEIVKGAASSAWGSALGGVINVITKNPGAERPAGGMLSASLGKRGTADGRAELTGTIHRFGYYLTGGILRSDGLLPNNWVDQHSFYGKLRYELPERGVASLSTLYTDGESGQFGGDQFKVNQDGRQLLSTLSVLSPVTDSFSIELTLRARLGEQGLQLRSSSNNPPSQTRTSDESAIGGNLNLSWIGEMQRVVAGVDYDHARGRANLSLPAIQIQQDLLNRTAERVGVYLNDTVTLGNFAITPSARFDHTGTGQDLFSPSLGVTYALTENSVVRGYTSRGYSVTSLNLADATEKVWTSQVGFETGDVPFLWLKGTLFRNDTWNISAIRPPENKQRLLKQGAELEVRTLPLWDTSLSAGYTFIDARDADTGGSVDGVPHHAVEVGIKYQTAGNFRALLTGRYTDWKLSNSPEGKDGDFIWDLHLAQRFPYGNYGSLDIFASVRNLLNGRQYLSNSYPNARTWAEAGVRCSF